MMQTRPSRTFPARMAPRLPAAMLLAGAVWLGAAHPAAATSMKACGEKYQAAKTAGTLNGQDWNAFRAAQCGSTPATAPAVAPAATTAAVAPVPVPAAAGPATPTVVPGHTAPPPTAMAAAPVAAGNAVLPARIDPKYASLKAGAARRKTCDDQYKANKANGGNGGLPWNQKGGGYYSLCNKKLKGA